MSEDVQNAGHREPRGADIPPRVPHSRRLTRAAKVVYIHSTMKSRTNIYLRPDQLKKLKAISKKTGSSAAELIRRAVDAYLKDK